MAHLAHPTTYLNTDGRAHPVENRFATAALLLGLVAVAASVLPGLHLVSSWVGLAGIGFGAWAQLISATTGQRFLAVLGLGAAGLGFYLGMAHGGLFGGWLG
ncbi:hypothetical protein [Streptomyces sp. MP131-18]|uniref:hypothetical protein n=1 Tax=Streptomyces sp. MP131-18 TaxID=1857892 RepID=UPI00097BF9A1|nr:hypothetical protein [Streptomyces sp. MP131-18]ONK12822.1 hypothetical protein STBA_35770 [Streptomyces sp. MP131-18]